VRRCSTYTASPPDRLISARNVIAAVLRRLAHGNPNVQLYTLSLTEGLSKNCGKDLHREIASGVFTRGLERIVTDRVSIPHPQPRLHADHRFLDFRPRTTMSNAGPWV
jgi:hypothetical protein